MKTAAISTAALLSMGVLEGTAAFAPEQRPSNPTVRVAAPVEDRRAFVGGVISAAFGAAAFSNTPAAWADDEEKVEDLAMPAADEQKALDVSLPTLKELCIRSCYICAVWCFVDTTMIDYLILHNPKTRLLKRCKDQKCLAPEKELPF